MSAIDASLYIHIPFCASFCDYCDFYSVKISGYNDDYIDMFISALYTDIKHQIEYFDIKKFPTVYIGGGTPSALGKKTDDLFKALEKLPSFTPSELSIEANPETLTDDFLCICDNHGVNRLSLGIQTFNEASRASVNRAGTGLELMRHIEKAVRIFPAISISVDLITGLPYQNEKTVMDDIKRVLDIAPGHISLYSLTIEEETALAKKIIQKKITLPPDDLSDSLWLIGRDLLVNAGFHHYEVSNFTINENFCLHNIRYWKMKNWIGAGPSASGTIINEGTAKRYTYLPDIDAYIKNPSIEFAAQEELDKYTLIKESLLMGFRYYEGPDSRLFKQRFGVTVEECIPQTLDRWKNKDKMLFLNRFLTDAFEEIASNV